MVRYMTVKTTINIDEETWRRFKDTVSSHQGSLRNLSNAVEEAIKCFNTNSILEQFAEEMGIKTGAYPSLREVEENRPRLGTSAAKEVREMRDGRNAHLPRHK